MRKLLAIRDARLLLAGETLSMFGTWILLIVLAIWVKELTGSSGGGHVVGFAVAVAVAVAVAGVGVSWAIVAFGTAIQRRSPAHLQGRVFSAADTMLTIPQTASIGIGAALVTVLDYRILLAVMATVTILCGVYLLTRESEPDVALAVSTPVPAE